MRASDEGGKRTPPSFLTGVPSNLNSTEEERVVLGSLLSGCDDSEKVMGLLRSKDFFFAVHQKIFEGIQQSYASLNSIDAVSVMAASLNKPTAGITMGYLLSLSKDYRTEKCALQYARIVKEKAALRSLLDVLGEAVKKIQNDQVSDVGQFLEDTTDRLASIYDFYNPEDKRAGAIESALGGVIKAIQWRNQSPGVPLGIPTGFTKLDDITLGLQKGELIVVAGRPAMGKTAFVMNIVEHVLQDDKLLVAVFSMEMSASQLLTRMISSVGRIKLRTIRTGRLEGEDQLNLKRVLGMLESSRLVIDDSSNHTINSIRSKIIRWRAAHKTIGLIVIDYIQLMGDQAGSDSRAAEVAQISRSLRSLAKELGVPIIVISQLNRSLEQRVDKRPIISDLKESGAIEQDADLILFVHREEVYNPTPKNKGRAEIIIGKHRNGPTGSISLNFFGEYVQFRNS
ncbi:replicative DNA helicase [Candidatus Tremblaya phenacola PAVE]|nr:replicative DNA helicase [Candidatus Tremblaya phenacola PAVE]